MKTQDAVEALPLRLTCRVILPSGYAHLSCVGTCGIIAVLMRIICCCRRPSPEPQTAGRALVRK